MAKKFVFKLAPLLLAREAAERKVLQGMAPLMKKLGMLRVEKNNAESLRKQWLGIGTSGSEVRFFLKEQLAFLSIQQKDVEDELQPHKVNLQKARAAKRALELLRDEKKKMWKKEYANAQQLEITQRTYRSTGSKLNQSL